MRLLYCREGSGPGRVGPGFVFQFCPNPWAGRVSDFFGPGLVGPGFGGESSALDWVSDLLVHFSKPGFHPGLVQSAQSAWSVASSVSPVSPVGQPAAVMVSRVGPGFMFFGSGFGRAGFRGVNFGARPGFRFARPLSETWLRSGYGIFFAIWCQVSRKCAGFRRAGPGSLPA